MDRDLHRNDRALHSAPRLFFGANGSNVRWRVSHLQSTLLDRRRVHSKNNNCYNYSNNKRTDTFAQPGLRVGAMWQVAECSEVRRAAVADGLTLQSGGACPTGESLLALVVDPGFDFH